MRYETLLYRQLTPLALLNQSSFLLASTIILHIAGGFTPVLHACTLWIAAALAIIGLQKTMATYQTPGPDLASILQTLAASAPAYPQAPQTQRDFISQSNFTYQAEAHGDTELEEGEYEPEDSYDPSLPLITTPHPQLQSQAAAPPHHFPPSNHLQPPPETLPYQPPLQNPPPPQPVQHHPPPPQPVQHHPTPPPAQHQQPQQPPPTKKPSYTPPTPPPSTILTWPPALRHITTLTTTSPTFTPRITHLIKTQHSHERQWHASRTALLAKLSSRDEKKRQLDSVLTSIGGAASNTSTNSNNTNNSNNPTSSALSQSQELLLFDRKVYKASQEMATATMKELEKLEVPFFCTMGGLVSERGGREKRKGTITEEELRGLRGRMVELLEDLCGEERGEEKGEGIEEEV